MKSQTAEDEDLFEWLKHQANTGVKEAKVLSKEIGRCNVNGPVYKIYYFVLFVFDATFREISPNSFIGENKA